MIVAYKELFQYFFPSLEDKPPIDVSSFDISKNAILAYNSFKHFSYDEISKLYFLTLDYSIPKKSNNSVKVFFSPFFEYTMFLKTIQLARNVNLYNHKIFEDEVFKKTWNELFRDILFRTKYYFSNVYDTKHPSLNDLTLEFENYNVLESLFLDSILHYKTLSLEEISTLFSIIIHLNSNSDEDAILLEVKRDLKILSNKKA